MVLDIILIVILLISAYRGWQAGALTMLLSIAILVVAGILASSFAESVGNLLKIGPLFARPVVGFVFAFIVLIILGGFLKRLIKPKRGLLRGLDAIVGCVLGLLRGAFILSVVLVLFALVHLPPESATQKSRLYPTVLKTSTTVIGVLKPYVREKVASHTSVV